MDEFCQAEKMISAGDFHASIKVVDCSLINIFGCALLIFLDGSWWTKFTFWNLILSFYIIGYKLDKTKSKEILQVLYDFSNMPILLFSFQVSLILFCFFRFLASCNYLSIAFKKGVPWSKIP